MYNSLSLSLSIYIYIYTHICICLYICRSIRLHHLAGEVAGGHGLGRRGAHDGRASRRVLSLSLYIYIYIYVYIHTPYIYIYIYIVHVLCHRASWFYTSARLCEIQAPNAQLPDSVEMHVADIQTCDACRENSECSGLALVLLLYCLRYG